MKFNKKIKNIYLYLIYQILQNKFLFGVSVIYAILMISIIDWGIPGLSHPFNYQMDEWHQFQAVRTTFKDFSANVPGSAHGTMFHFILSGIYLIPFYLFGIINPFMLKSSVDLLEVQQRLFEILRLNTLIFGLFSIFIIAKIAKDHLKINPNIPVALFVISPLWLSLSNYFKYDIALTFWILVSIFFLLRFGTLPTLKNYLLAGFFCSLAVATKISALPLLIIYIIAFFYFMHKKQKDYSYLFMGVFLFLVTFLVFGVPDLLLQKGDYGEYFYSNIISAPKETENMILDYRHWWAYILLKILPLDFGYGFIAIYSFGILYWIILFIKSILNKKILFKKEFFLLFCFLLFCFSLIPLKLGASGNRLLVLLPFFALLSASFLQRMKIKSLVYKIVFGLMLLLIFIIQFYQSMIMVYVKWLPDVREISSGWMQKNIKKGSLIGIENIPIYQLLPDVIVRDFYSKDRIYNYSTNFDYQIIDASSRIMPPIVIVTGKELDFNYFKKSPKKQLIDRLTKEGYKETIEFKPPSMLYLFAGNELNYFTSGLAPISSISVFEKHK